MQRLPVCAITCGILMLSAGPSTLAATPLGAAFTYQGKLELNGSPVTDTSPGCDFEFSLWDDPAAGAQIASVAAQPVTVTAPL